MPNGAAGLAAEFSEFAGGVTNNISALGLRTQDAVTAFYQSFLAGDSSLEAVVGFFTSGILGGFLGLADLLSKIVAALTGSPGALTDLQTFAIARWSDLADALTHIGSIFTAFGGDLTSMQAFVSTAGTAATNAANAVAGLAAMVAAAGVADATAVGAALAGAVTNAGTAVTNASSALSSAGSALTKIAAIVSAAGAASEAALGSAVASAGTNASSALTQIGQAVSSAAVADANGLGAAVSGAVSGLEANLAGWFNSWTGSSASSATQSQANTAAAQQATNIVQNGSAITSLQASAGVPYVQSAGLLNFVVNFANYANDTSLAATPFSFSASTAGVIGVTNGQAVGNPAGTSVTIYGTTPSPSISDYQSVSAVWTGFSGALITPFLAGRSNTARTTAVVAEVLPTSIVLYCTVAGVAHSMYTLSGYTPIPGATYTLLCGTSAGLYHYQVLCNGALLFDYADSPTTPVAQVGSLYRYAYTGFGGGTHVNAPMSYFSCADQVFYPGPAKNGYVSASESTTVSAFGALATAGPVASVTIGSSGAAWVQVSADMGNNGWYSRMSYALSGANTRAASASPAVQWQNPGSTLLSNTEGDIFLETGLAPGVTTFTAQYGGNSGNTATFANRRIAVMPI